MNIDVAKRQLARKDQIAKFIVDPRQTIVDLGLDPDAEDVARTFEAYLADIIKAIEGANRKNLPDGTKEEMFIKGVGFGCCNV